MIVTYMLLIAANLTFAWLNIHGEGNYKINSTIAYMCIVGAVMCIVNTINEVL